MKAKSIQPTVRVSQRFNNGMPAELFVMSRVAISCESGLDELSFCVGEEPRSGRIVLDEPVSRESYEDRCNAFLSLS
jgi:hypothetical protein